MRVICLFSLLFFISPLWAQNGSRLALDKELTTLKNQDKLSDWLYSRISYNAEKPAERLSFLMATATEVWRKPKSSPELEAWLNLLINQGYYQLYAGNVLQSIEQYENAYDFYQQNPIKNFDLVEYIFKPLGNNYTRLGDYSNSLFIQKKSLEIAKKNLDSLSVASIYNNLAISYKSMGELDQARKMCLSGFDYLNSGSSVSGLLKSTLADVQYEQGQYDEASKTITSALKVLSYLKHNSYTAYWLLSAYTLAGNIEQKRGNIIQAEQFYQIGLKLLDVSFKGSRRREKANLLIQSGNIYLLGKSPKEALKKYNQALQTLIPGYKNIDERSLPSVNELYSENRLYDALEGRANAFLMMNKEELALNNFLLALKTGNKSRNEFTDTSDRLYYQKHSKKLAEAAINTAYSLWRKTGNSKYSMMILSLTEETKARTLLDQIEKNQQFLSGRNNHLLKQQAALKRAIVYYEKEYLLNNKAPVLNNKQEAQYKLSLLEKEIKKKYPTWNHAGIDNDFPPEKLITTIPSSSSIISFFWGEDKVYIIKAKKGSIDTIIQLSNARGLTNKVEGYIQTYFQHGPAAMTNHPERFFSESHTIYQQLLAPVLGTALYKNLVIITDGVLGYLPFESLITSNNYSSNISKWPFLIKKAPVSYVYSIRTSLTSNFEKSSSDKNFSGFFISKTKETVAIPAVAEEAENLEHLINGAIFIDDNASLQNFTQALNTSSSLHLSTHSYLFGKEQEPVLQLSDGKFFLFELSAQSRVPKLVVLSACRTADGIMAAGEGVLSLSRGFTAAGTVGVVAGLWNVNDVSTAQIITHFYINLQQGKDAATSLHEAKLDWLKQEQVNPALLLPYYWSSLIYIGKRQTISLKPATDYDLLYWTLLGGSIATFVGFLIRKKSKSGSLKN